MRAIYLIGGVSSFLLWDMALNHGAWLRWLAGIAAGLTG